ncbi:MAG: BatD family protein [Acidobacteriota bacterium]
MRAPTLRTGRAALLVAILGLGWAAVAAAAEPSLEVSFDPRKFGIEDVARLVVRVNEPGEGQPVPDLGRLENLEVVSGPSVGTEFSWINGRATRATNFTYVLQGREIGPAAVGPIVVTVGGTELRSEVVQAEVVAGSVAPPRSTNRRSPFFLDPFADPFARGQSGGSAARVVLRQLVSAKKAVLGEPVIATIVLDTTAGVDGFEWVEAPSYPGWWAQRVEPPERVTSEPVEVDGLRYDRFIVGRNVLVPLKTGELEVPEIRARIGFRSRSVFAAPQVVERSAPASMVEIEPRPEAPKGFSGAVGNLRYSASLEPTVIDFGESAVLSIELEGSGNLPLVDVPAKWPVCADCETYPPEEESQFTVDASGIHGSRAWRMTIVPRSWGPIDFEPVMLAVFDPAAGIYRKQTLGPLHLEVNAPPPTPTPPIPVETPAAEGKTPTEPGSENPREQEVPEWAWIIGATALERWWLDARSKTKGKALEEDMNRLRRDLEAVRFAPGRADHTQTVAELEERVRALIRRA